MTFDPTRTLGRKENSLELSDGEVSHFTGHLRVQRQMKSLGDLIFNEVGSGNISERQSGQRTAGFSAHVVIARATDAQIAFFEVVGEHEYFTKPVAIHG